MNIRIFDFNNITNMGNEITDWLSLYPEVVIKFVTQSSEGTYISISIFYEIDRTKL